MRAHVVTRPADPKDARRLREVAAAAKGYWGYDEELVRTWAAGIELEGEIEVVEEDGTVVGWSALLPGQDGVYVLEDLWVAPPWMGRGLGAELIRRAAARAREHGATALELGADPNAVGFYERMDAATVGTATGSWGRELPVMEITL